MVYPGLRIPSHQLTLPYVVCCVRLSTGTTIHGCVGWRAGRLFIKTGRPTCIELDTSCLEKRPARECAPLTGRNHGTARRRHGFNELRSLGLSSSPTSSLAAGCLHTAIRRRVQAVLLLTYNTSSLNRIGVRDRTRRPSTTSRGCELQPSIVRLMLWALLEAPESCMGSSTASTGPSDQRQRLACPDSPDPGLSRRCAASGSAKATKPSASACRTSTSRGHFSARSRSAPPSSSSMGKGSATGQARHMAHTR